jgi:hypothetical protein
MKLIIPTIVDDDILVSTTVDETIATEWSGASTYADGDFVYVADGTQRDVYESLQGSNLNKDPETETDWWRFRSITYDEYNAGTTYADGDIVIDATNHLRYESLQAANTGNALTEVTWWLEIGSTEPWKVFDAKVGSQTERVGSMYFELEPGLAEGVTLLNVDAESVQIVITDPTDGEVYNETIDLISTENVFDGYSYCFAPFITTDTVAKTDFPPYGSATLEITLTAGSDTETVKCGEIVVGAVREFGDSAQYGASFEIIDYSRKTTDDFGNYSVTERAFSKRVPIEVYILNDHLRFLKKTLEDYRATPVVCIPTEVENLLGSLIVYGYYKRAQTVVKYPNYSLLTIEWEGLT